MAKLLHVKQTRAKGRVYYYFRTGQMDPRGREILARLPAPKDPGFGSAYASFMAARTRRASVAAESTVLLSVEQFCDLYERSPHFAGLAQGSQRLYGFSLRYFRKMLPTAPAGELERRDIVRLVDGRAEQPGAANSMLRAIRALYKWGRERGHVENDPCRDVAELPIGEHEPWPDHVLKAALEADDDLVRLGVHLLFYSAQRIGDVVRMKRTDVRDGRLEVIQQKTKRTLSIPLHPALKRELDQLPPGIGYIVAQPNGRPMTAQTLREALQEFAGRRGAKVVPHGLRKNAVNALLEAGCSAAETASITGQSLGMVEHYAKARSQHRLGDAAVLKWQRHRR
jgi:integrase